MDVLEHVEFAFGDELLLKKAIEGIEDSGSGKGLQPSFGHGKGVFGFGIAKHNANSENEEFVTVKLVLREHPSVYFEYVGFLHIFDGWCF